MKRTPKTFFVVVLTAVLAAPLVAGFSFHAQAAPRKIGGSTSSARADFLKTLTQVVPGETQTSGLKGLLGEPLRVFREGAGKNLKEYYFYDLGEGASMDATVFARNGVVEYMTYLCDDSLSDIKNKSKQAPTESNLSQTAQGYSGRLKQVFFDDLGKGYVYEPRSKKIKACLAWTPGSKAPTQN